MNNLQTKLPIDVWLTATWDEYIQTVEKQEKAKCYYHNGQLRIEMAPQGYDHSYNNFSVGAAVALFSGIKAIPLVGVTNCSFRKIGTAEVQPDLAFYIGENAEIIPPDTTIIDLNIYPPPDLIIEIAKTSFSDDIGSKRMLYEKLNCREYWVVNVAYAQLIAFEIVSGGSRAIDKSQVLPPLPFSLLEEALRRCRTTGRSQIYAWLISQIQNI
ncbi:Uma2 family endonuclease [Okeania sp.]|uniref:Uma2 family endonuclease n=1 Tax=Okeania sp. TaxID=3100323 RepID=UPI002B4B5BE7|nr:Uma2 family endonuclease [Okeania sp.]MEB3341160.1 Uma2 family endonuclease [Okeania sp.]